MVEKYEMYSVHKRDGRVVRFNIDAISKAVSKAIEAVRGTDRQPSIIYDEIVANTAKVVCDNAKDMVIDIEDIQNEVEKQLIQANLADVAKAYILYREQRNKARNVSSIVNKTITELVMVDAKDLDAKRENANINGDSTIN